MGCFVVCFFFMLNQLFSDFQVVVVGIFLLKFFLLFFPVSFSTDIYQGYFTRTDFILKVVSSFDAAGTYILWCNFVNTDTVASRISIVYFPWESFLKSYIRYYLRVWCSKCLHRKWRKIMWKHCCSTFAIFDEKIGLNTQMCCIWVNEGPGGLVRANSAPVWNQCKFYVVFELSKKCS